MNKFSNASQKFLSLCCWASKPNLRVRLFSLFALCILPFALCLLPVQAQQPAPTRTYTLQAGVSIEQVPKDFYGTWRVSAKIIDTNNPEIFKKNSVDLWNLFRVNNVITLENPFSGAQASIIVDELRGQFIRFQKIGNYNNDKLADTVELNLKKESFTGINYLKLDTISDIDGHVMKSYWAKYAITGEKISGASIKK